MLSLLALVALAAVACAEPTGGIVWQGFGYEWLHRILGFETPHRLGSFASAVIDSQTTFDGLGATYYAALTPGVSGDYAHPVTHYTGIKDESGSMVFEQGSWSFSFRDASNNHTAAPQANTDLSFSFAVPGVSSYKSV